MSLFGNALGGVVGGATVKLFLDKSQFDAGLRQARGETEAGATAMGKLGGLAKAGFAVAGAAAVKFGADSVKAFSESQAIAAQTTSVLESTGGAANVTADDVGNLASSISKLTGIDDEAVQASENLLLTFRDIQNAAGAGNDIFNQTERAITDMATAMNQGAIPSQEQLAQTTIQVGKAMNDPIRGMTALRRVGVEFNDSQVETITQLQKSGDLMGAQKMILAELTAEFGGAAEAAGDTFAGSMAKAQNKVDNFKEAVGQGLAAALLGLTGDFDGAARTGLDLNVMTAKGAQLFNDMAAASALDASAVGSLTAEQSANRTEMQHSTDAQLGYAAALAEGEPAYARAADAAQALADSNANAAREARNLYNAQLSLAGGLLGIEGASLSAAQAQQDLRDANAEVNKLQDKGKQGTREYRDALSQQRQAALGATQSQLSLVQSVQDYIAENGRSASSTREAVGLIRQYGRDAGLTKGQIRGLIDNVLGLVSADGRVPPSVQTHYLALGLAGNLSDLARYNQYLASLDGKQVYITVHTTYIETNAPHGGIQ